jgi:hypothetical protein
LLAAAAAINALAYSALTANWVLAADNWYFVERIVYQYAHGDWHLADLLVKRGPLDHAQPLRRLLLLANYEWFDLDFRVEAICAVVSGIASFGLLCWAMRRELSAAMPLACLSCVALAAVYFSLSSPIVFTWSLLTLGFTSHFVLFLWLVASWKVLEAPAIKRALLLVAVSFLFGLIADDTAVAAIMAGILAAALRAIRAHERRKGACVQAVASVAGILLYVGFYRIAAPPQIVMEQGTASLHGVQWQGLVASANDAWRWIAVPLASAFVQRSTLVKWLGDAEVAVPLLGFASLLAHAWFWKQAVLGVRNRTAYMATAIMLLFYALVAGIVLGRVSVHGTDYLWQPRYAFIYRWHVVALLMMLIAQAAVVARAERRHAFAKALAVLLMLLQVPLAAAAWQGAKYVRRNSANLADQLVRLDADPASLPRNACSRSLAVCRFDDARRQRLLGFMKERNLNVFSATVRARNGYAPGE